MIPGMSGWPGMPVLTGGVQCEPPRSGRRRGYFDRVPLFSDRGDLLGPPGNGRGGLERKAGGVAVTSG